LPLVDDTAQPRQTDDRIGRARGAPRPDARPTSRPTRPNATFWWQLTPPTPNTIRPDEGGVHQLLNAGKKSTPRATLTSMQVHRSESPYRTRNGAVSTPKRRQIVQGLSGLHRRESRTAWASRRSSIVQKSTAVDLEPTDARQGARLYSANATAAFVRRGGMTTRTDLHCSPGNHQRGIDRALAVFATVCSPGKKTSRLLDFLFAAALPPRAQMVCAVVLRRQAPESADSTCSVSCVADPRTRRFPVCCVVHLERDGARVELGANGPFQNR
jgi:hypothetical protein